MVGFEDDDADEHETLQDDQENNLRLAIRLTKCDKHGFGEEGNEQGSEIPMPLRTVLTPQRSVIRPGIEIGPAECQERGIPDETHNGEE